ncbi:3798_t:CDS:2 [Ambispora gerdemannii]|uniref:3798_t:CDS:1 n=1 Tax=Ambispora gerdemannii TaxID=144530 RepID=A0A9N8WLS0_9GLOM|nr:3798_t:CDS:2 [Ambispora gerdemannii]
MQISDDKHKLTMTGQLEIWSSEDNVEALNQILNICPLVPANSSAANSTLQHQLPTPTRSVVFVIVCTPTQQAK